jgi:hypothetical protein
MYMSVTWLQVTNQFVAGLERFREHRLFAGWQWLESEVRTASGGFLFGRSSDVAGFVEDIHDQHGSPAGLLIDEAKSIRDNIHRYPGAMPYYFSALYELNRTGERRVLPHHDRQRTPLENLSGPLQRLSPRQPERDRGRPPEPQGQRVQDQTRGRVALTDAGDSMIALEHVRALIEVPPVHISGRPVAFCDFAGPGDESLLAICDGN